MLRTYGPFRSADAEPDGERRYPNGVVRRVTTDANGLTTVVWDYTDDVHKEA